MQTLPELKDIQTQSDLLDLVSSLDSTKRQELDKYLKAITPVWVPLQGPQTQALSTEADILFYGGAAGGGKTDLLIGLSATQHTNSVIFRREGTQHKGIIRRFTEIIGNRDGFNSQNKQWSHDNRLIDLGSCQHLGDEIVHQGIPHDLVGFDEITHFLESQFRFLIGWNRTTKAGQRCRIVCAGNPPTDSDGDWVKQYWGPWLDEHHENPAQPGELRWYATIEGDDIAVENNKPFILEDEQPVYDFNPDDYSPDDIITPQSRTFIPSKVTDNPFLMDTGYMSKLQALPEPLRSQMLKGDFTAGTDDDPWQVIPTEWVRQAQARWKAKDSKGVLDSMGVDVARGGRDETVIANRYGSWYDEPIAYPGTATPDGPSVCAVVITNRRDKPPVHVAVIGVGTSVVDHAKDKDIHVVALNNAEGTKKREQTGKPSF